MSPGSIKEKFDAYLKAFNSHDTEAFGQFYADDFHAHWTSCPVVKSRSEVIALFKTGLSFFRETIHPTYLIFGDRSVAMEAKMDSEALVDINSPFPFTGKTYKKGEKFVYPIMYAQTSLFPSVLETGFGRIAHDVSVHYEYNDEFLMTTFRSFSEVLQPGPGEGILQNVLPGY